MQTILTTKASILSEAVTCAMLIELATKHLGYTPEAAQKMAEQKLNKGSKYMVQLTCAKLRTIIVQKLEDSEEYGAPFKTNELMMEYDCLPDLDMGNAGANSRRAGGGRKAATGELKGAYTVVKRGLKCTAESDPAKFALWQLIFGGSSFEEVFKAAEPKYVTKTGRIITPTSEFRWALKQGWIVPAEPAAE